MKSPLVIVLAFTVIVTVKSDANYSEIKSTSKPDPPSKQHDRVDKEGGVRQGIAKSGLLTYLSQSTYLNVKDNSKKLVPCHSHAQCSTCACRPTQKPICLPFINGKYCTCLEYPINSNSPSFDEQFLPSVKPQYPNDLDSQYPYGPQHPNPSDLVDLDTEYPYSPQKPSQKYPSGPNDLSIQYPFGPQKPNQKPSQLYPPGLNDLNIQYGPQKPKKQYPFNTIDQHPYNPKHLHELFSSDTQDEVDPKESNYDFSYNPNKPDNPFPFDLDAICKTYLNEKKKPIYESLPFEIEEPSSQSSYPSQDVDTLNAEKFCVQYLFGPKKQNNQFSNSPKESDKVYGTGYYNEGSDTQDLIDQYDVNNLYDPNNYYDPTRPRQPTKKRFRY